MMMYHVGGHLRDGEVTELAAIDRLWRRGDVAFRCFDRQRDAWPDRQAARVVLRIDWPMAASVLDMATLTGPGVVHRYSPVRGSGLGGHGDSEPLQKAVAHGEVGVLREPEICLRSEKARVSFSRATVSFSPELASMHSTVPKPEGAAVMAAIRAASVRGAAFRFPA